MTAGSLDDLLVGESSFCEKDNPSSLGDTLGY